MDLHDYNIYAQKHQVKITQIARRLWLKNREYTIKEIESMIHSEIWEYKKVTKITFKGLYLATLNRILDEKGYKYKENKLFNPIVAIEDTSNLIPQNYYDGINKTDYSFIIEDFFDNSELNQDEVFVMALSFGLSTPKELKGHYRKQLDNIEDVYYSRLLTQKEIAGIMQIPIPTVKKLRKEAFRKLKNYAT